jgi:hypothetical protein
LAVVWDKIGLGHNGQRLPSGGHSVLVIGGSESVISEAEWPAFLADQAQRHAALVQWRRDEAERKTKSEGAGFRLIDLLRPFAK